MTQDDTSPTTTTADGNYRAIIDYERLSTPLRMGMRYALGVAQLTT